MAPDALLFSLATVALISSTVAAFAVASLRRALRSTPAKKPTPPSPEELSRELESAAAFEKMSHALRKVDNRLRMREARETSGPGRAPPEGADKAAIWRHYGFTQAGPRFAQHQLELERNSKEH